MSLTDPDILELNDLCNAVVDDALSEKQFQRLSQWLKESHEAREFYESYGVKREIPSGRWNTLSVVFKDSLFTVFLNGDRLFEAEDQTFKEAGKAGLWTKADSVTHFDSLAIRPLPETGK